MHVLKMAIPLLLLPSLVAGQQDPVERLRAVLPASVAAEVIAIVQDATSRGLPGEFVAARALEARAKGRTDVEVSGAARQSVERLTAAHAALVVGRPGPSHDEIEAAATAQAQGVDGKSISALASSAPSGRSLAVPIAVLGALVSRGLPSDAALQAVQERLAARASNADIAKLPAAASHGAGAGTENRPSGAPPVGGVGAGGTTPSGVTPNPGGPPAGIPQNPGRSGEDNPGKGKAKGKS